MRKYLAAVIILSTCFFDYGQNNPVNISPVFGYHSKWGIPRASIIRKMEANAENSSTNAASQRIVGGSVTDISKIPYQVGLVIKLPNDVTSICGGSLISTNRVLTAAHCHNDGVDSAEAFIAVLGSNTIFRGGLRIYTDDVEVHPSWKPIFAENDIAVLKIENVAFTDVIQPISLPSEFLEFVNENSLASGFGSTSNDGAIPVSQVIYSVELTIISNQECRKSFGQWIRSSIICTSGEGGLGTCGGDSGGPLAVTSNNEKILVGITSFGGEDCESGYPSAYTRITSYLTWISSVS